MNKSLSINGVVKHYQELKHNDNIKLVFRKSDIFSHKSIDNKAFYTVRPIIAKIGEWLDDGINYSFTIKNKFYRVIKNKDHELWCLTINKDIKTFALDENNECEYHDTSLQFITNPKLLAWIVKVSDASSNVSEFSGDSL